MTIRSLSKLTKVIGLASLAAVASVASIGAYAVDTTNVSLTVTGGQLTIYAGDDNWTGTAAGTPNHDICTPANITAGATVDTTVSGGTASSVVCSTVENSLNLSGLTVASVRQSSIATMDDVVFEDLRGLATSDYTITATVSDFTAASPSTGVIELGTNPDAVTSDTDPDAPTGGDANELFAKLDASGGTVTVLRDATAISEGITNYSKGSNTTVVDTTTPVTLLSTSAAVRPPRAALDGVQFKLRAPALVQAGAYSGTITQTIV